MTPSELSYPPKPAFADELSQLVEQLPEHPHGKWIQRALETIISIANDDIDRLDWKILAATLKDLENAFQTFYPYRHTRKITIFGSARIAPHTSEYQLAVKFAHRVTQLGFMVLTGGGGGIMQAGNEGAGLDNSFGLNIQLPFEQSANPYIEGDDKLINFKYFFTRKLFFLRESDAVALFPGGFGTQDEAFETLTLCQTGKYGPAPLVLIDEPGKDYWRSWNEHIHQNLLKRKLISPEDPSLYTVTDDIDHACEVIRNFYCLYHSSRYVNDLFVMRLNSELPDDVVEQLNADYGDILSRGKIEKSNALPSEKKDDTHHLPRLIFYFDQQSFGRLYQMINHLNTLGSCLLSEPHPERK